MPELPEVEAALELLRNGAKGRTITHVTLLHPALQRRFTTAQLDAMSGARIARVERRGKHQLLHFEDRRVLHAHFRMNGDWSFVDTGQELPRFARAVLDLDDGRSLVFVDSRMLGTIDLHPAGADLDLGLGPDAADPDWTAEQLHAALAVRRGPIKPALLDQALVAGLGNIYAAESLWRAKISPLAACASLTMIQVSALRKAIADVIVRATGSRYTDDDTVELDVYDREGLPCRRCGTPIERVTQAQRSTYYCPHCQPAVVTESSTATKRSKAKSPKTARSPKTAKSAKTAKGAKSAKTAKTAKRVKTGNAPAGARRTKASAKANSANAKTGNAGSTTAKRSTKISEASRSAKPVKRSR
ncbi:MAG TPA: bifunctional DNA-formamidopyrimidine glycosylase/DNA-(apurinic or apyrimidinic site) lyase [Gemmatimonadaceae bacterium]|jgi:formamidopyrimidine-DNA glycosylase|nr:bifunctional DNA-formamidopyrimidine glycosylase/DNA-(apurinic or apyrimidinic site) lyase [Gemmatimonadaceae bacterium]